MQTVSLNTFTLLWASEINSICLFGLVFVRCSMSWRVFLKFLLNVRSLVYPNASSLSCKQITSLVYVHQNTSSLSCKQITSTLSLVDMCSGLKNTFWVIHWCSQLQIPFHCIVWSCMFQEKRDVHPEAELFSPEELPFSVCWTWKKRTGFQQALSFIIFWTKQTHNSYRE